MLDRDYRLTGTQRGQTVSRRFRLNQREIKIDGTITAISPALFSYMRHIVDILLFFVFSTVRINSTKRLHLRRSRLAVPGTWRRSICKSRENEYAYNN
jgi:hypothetical protein